MRLITKSLVIMTATFSGGLSACTTVDLTQVAVNQPQETRVKPEQNVVLQTSLSLTSMFHAKGWCKSDPSEKTTAATNVLLNGKIADNQNSTVETATPIDMAQLIADMAEANYQVEQTTKAAEVYLVVASDMIVLDKELSQLEAALLSSKEAQANFAKSANAVPTDTLTALQKLDEIAKSIDNLKIVTDAYGDRIRAQIAARADGAGS